MTKKIDRRVSRTKESLSDALTALIMEGKPYHKITVQDILDKANIGRATFYAHFQDKDDLLLGGIPTPFFQFIEPSTHIDGHPPDLSHLFQHIEEQSPLLKTLLGTNGADFLIEAVRRELYHSFIRWAQAQSSQTIQPEVTAHFLTGGLLSLITWWLDAGLPVPSDQLNQMFQQLVSPHTIPLLLTNE